MIHMRIESWQITYIIGVFIGLLIGWYLNPYLGAAFIWAMIITVEVLHAWREKSPKKREKNVEYPKAGSSLEGVTHR